MFLYKSFLTSQVVNFGDSQVKYLEGYGKNQEQSRNRFGGKLLGSPWSS